jgi:hypothetical protein
MADEPRLNSVERFRKQSERLVLEAHAHCEVPAGCGGVVLRWRNPWATRTVLLYAYAPVKVLVLLDGEKPNGNRVDLAVGRHTLALELKDVELSAGLLMFAVTPKGQYEGPRTDTAVAEPVLQMATAADGTWKFTLTEPRQSWTAIDFDDAEWAALEQHPMPVFTERSEGRWASERCAQQGAAFLGLPARALPKIPTTGTIWIRKVFTVAAPE